MNGKKRAYLELHLAVFLFGFTAILGALLSLPAFMIVWWRVLFASISLFCLIQFGKNLKFIPKSKVVIYLGIGVLVGLHWLCFFGSIKYANASVALICMATASLFTSFIEPLVLRTRIKPVEVALGLVVIPAMGLIVNHLEVDMQLGFWIGLMAAFLASSFAVLNKKYIDDADPLSITFLELTSAWLFLSALLPFYYTKYPDVEYIPQGYDWIYLAILVLLCTTLAYVLALKSLQHLSAFASNLTINLEPVYGIVLAIVLLNENQELSVHFYWGVLIIFLSVGIYPFLVNKFYPSQS